VTVLAGGSLSYSLTATVDPAAGGTLANTASVTPQSGATDSNPANDAATDTDALTPQADLSIAKSDGQVAVVPAQALSYTITVANAGPSAATGATVTDTLPALLVGAAWTCSASPGSSCAGAGVGNINDTVTLLPGGTLSYSLSATVDPAAAAGPLANTASVAAPSGTADPNGANDSSTDTDTIGIPSLTIADGTVVEGHAGTTTASFTVTLSPAAAVPVTVNYVTQNVTALAGSDYAFTSGMLTFAPGETGKPIDVAVNGDTQFEAHETFRVVLSGATGGAEIDDGLAVGTIANDDAPTGPSRAFVSVAGADTNDCSNIATPCRTLNTAIAQVAEDGEVIVIQSGSYAGAMVTKSVKLTAAPGIVAFSGQPIVVDAGTGGRVVVRGMTLKAATPGSGSGLLIQSAGAVHLESSVVDGWAFGIRQQGAERLFVEDSVIRNNGTGIQASTGKASVEGTRLTNNGIGVASDFATVSLRGCTVSGNSAAGVSADSSSSVTLEKCQIANNGVGITLPAWSFSTVRLSRSVVSGNTVGLENVDGTLIVAGTNAVRGNTFDVSGSTTANGLQ
jgi:uncharacterized repeat protein (TIGR01451 family)